MGPTVTTSLDQLTREQFGNLSAAYPGLAVGYECDALWSYLNVLEEQIEHARVQYRLRSERALHRGGSKYSHEEFGEKLLELDRIADSHIPRFFRSGATVAIWGLFETSMSDFASYARDKENAPLKLGDIKAHNFRDQVYKYFSGALHIQLPWTKEQRDQLENLQKFRNQIAHKNGRIDTLSAEEMKKFRQIVSRTPEVAIEHDTLIVSGKYVNQSAELVTEVINALHKDFALRYLTNCSR